MAARKRMTRKEVKQTDPITARLEEISDQLVKNRVKIFAGLVAIVALLAVTGGVRYMQDAKLAKRAKAVSDAFSALSAPVGAEAAVAEGDAPTDSDAFVDEGSRDQAVSERLDTLAAGYAGETLGAVATWARAASGGGAEAPAKAGPAIDSVVGAAPEVSFLAALSKGRLAWSVGDAATARTAFESVANDESSPLMARMTATIALGDLTNPSFGAKPGDVEASRKQYRKVLADIDTSTERGLSHDGLRREAALRLALLPGGAAERLEPPEPVKAGEHGGEADTAKADASAPTP